MQKHLPTGTFAALAFLSIATIPAHAAGAGSDAMLFGKDPGQKEAQACFVRHYTSDHLASHPKQNVKDMLLFVNSYSDTDKVRQYNLEMGVNFQQADKMFFVSGGCGSSVDGAEMLNCGIDCDGGHIDVDIKDVNSLLVGIPDGARTWDAEADETEDENASPPAMWGDDDKLFRLDRADLATCLPLVADDELRAQISGKK